MSYRGDIVPGQTLNFKFTTVTASGAGVIFTGSPALVAYKDTSTASTTAGITLTASFGGITGSNHVSINTGADGTFYSAGSDFMVMISAGTAGGVSVVGYNVGEFSINNRSALRPTTAGRTLDVTATGGAGIDWSNVENPTSVVGLSSTTISASQVVASVTGAVGSVTGNVGGNVAGSVGSVTAAVTVGTNNDKTGYALSSAGNAAVMTTTMTESYAAVNVAPTPAQILFEQRALLAENNVTGTTVTTRKIDGSTTAATYDINSATTPTDITRSA